MSTETLVTDAKTEIAAAAAVLSKPVRKKPAPKHNFNDGLGRVFAHRHVNGGGWVADTAKVADAVFVGKRAAVYHRAQISGCVFLHNYAQVCGAAQLDCSGTLTEAAFIAGKTSVSGHIKVAGYARLYGGKFIGRNEVTHNARVQNDPTIQDCNLRESCFIAGQPKLIGSTISGFAMIGQQANVFSSTIPGNTRVAGHALIVHSALNFRNAFNRDLDVGCLLVTGHAKIVGSTVCALLHIKGHSVIVNATINFRPMLGQQNQGIRIDCIDTLCIPSATINTIPSFELFNTSNPAQRSGTPHTVVARLPEPFNLENIVPRRRLTPATP